MFLDYCYIFDGSYEEFCIFIVDGEIVNGLLFCVNGDKRGVVFYFYGNWGNLSWWGYLYYFFISWGYDVLMIDYWGYGKSIGKLLEIGFYKDGEVVL